MVIVFIVLDINRRSCEVANLQRFFVALRQGERSPAVEIEIQNQTHERLIVPTRASQSNAYSRQHNITSSSCISYIKRSPLELAAAAIMKSQTLEGLPASALLCLKGVSMSGLDTVPIV